MKKLYILLCFILLLSGCGMAINNTQTDSSESSSKSELKILGEYICSNDYYNDQYFVENPENIPSVTFYDNGSCKLFVNYLEGGCDVGGFYEVEDDYIKVELDFNNTIFEKDGVKYMDDKYVFNILNNDQIIIDREFYGVKAGDTFIKKETVGTFNLNNHNYYLERFLSDNILGIMQFISIHKRVTMYGDPNHFYY